MGKTNIIACANVGFIGIGLSLDSAERKVGVKRRNHVISESEAF